MQEYFCLCTRVFTNKKSSFRRSTTSNGKIYNIQVSSCGIKDLFPARSLQISLLRRSVFQLHVWKRYPYLALGSMNNPLCLRRTNWYGAARFLHVVRGGVSWDYHQCYLCFHLVVKSCGFKCPVTCSLSNSLRSYAVSPSEDRRLLFLLREKFWEDVHWHCEF